MYSLLAKSELAIRKLVRTELLFIASSDYCEFQLYSRSVLRKIWKCLCCRSAADRELDFFFGSRHSPRPLAKMQGDTTCCVIKPHAIREGQAGKILADLQKRGFQVHGLVGLHLRYEHAEEFLGKKSFTLWKGNSKPVHREGRQETYSQTNCFTSAPAKKSCLSWVDSQSVPDGSTA